MASKSPLKGRPLRVPGQALDEQIAEFIDDQAFIWCGMPMLLWALAALEWLAVAREAPRTPWTYTIAAAIMTVVGTIKILRARRKIRRLRLGRDGERVVGQFLDGLRVNGARIFHDIPGEGFNLDHVVISGHGIYVVETKTLSKPFPDAKVTFEGEQIFVAGRPMDRDPIRQARAEADWLKRMLEDSTGKRFAVQGVVVFPGWWVEPAPESVKSQAWVLEPKALPWWIEQQPVTIAPSDVALAAYHLSRYIRTADVQK